MPDWPGRSRRDQAIRTYVEPHLARVPGPLGPLPAVLLLGPRGSGKTTLLRHLGTWGRAAPVAALDLAAMELGDKTLFDALADLAFQLQARKDRVPPLGFPSFTVLLLAAAAAVSNRNRAEAVQQMRTLLKRDDRQEYSYESLQPLLDGAAAVAGGLLPGWTTQIIPVVRGTQRVRARVQLNRRIARASRDVGGPRAGADFLVGVNHLFRGYPEQQREAERLLCEAFLADLRAGYESRSGHGRRTAHCLVLLDNADSELGEALLELLLDARGGAPGRPGRADPLLVVTTARRPPEALVREEQRLPAPPDYGQSWTADGERFTPVRVGRLHAGLLRDLSRAEVDEHAAAVLATLPPGTVQPAADNASYWLGWTVHSATRGQPAATGAVLDAVTRFAPGTPWAERIQRWPALPARSDPADSRDRRPASVADTTLDLLLTDCDPGLRTVLPRAAAARTQGQAEAAPGLWRGVPPALRRRFEDDGGVLAHPLVRFLLLRRLDADGAADGPGSWDGAHSALRDAAVGDTGATAAAAAGGPAGSDGPPGTGGPGSGDRTAAGARTAAYHDLARELTGTAVDHLHTRFLAMRPGTAEQWCDDLSFIQRAPARRPGGHPEPARERYERLVGTPDGDEVRQAVTRLLVAGWITSHPHSDPYADLYEDPLGDPYAELYHYIAEEFRTLRRLIRSGERDRDVFDRKVRQYERKPW